MTHPVIPIVPVVPLAQKSGFSLQLHRGETFAIAIAGILLGIIALVWPNVTLVFIGVIFGAYLIVSGFVRLSAAIASKHVGAGHRFLVGLLGVIVLAAGVLCLIDPTRSAVLLAFVLGLGWIVSGIVDLMGAATGATRPRWVGLVSGMVSLLAGLVALTLPALTLQAFIVVGAILLISVSLISLLTVPRRGATAAW
ncbi:HdeD family acid-resistance protein [Leifsonia poae]|uniref:HdeD family acid-resistance protein n=1 Tax=Leifsonia poae TaxID=110933 RepID=UPI001CBF803B|nr:DUF308 domain-containing protein [Leifsonia poae]